MRIKEIKVFTFDELNDKAKNRARDWYRECLGGDEWYDGVYEDAKNIGLEITSFDLYHGEIDGNWLASPYKVIENIKKEHGETCDTFKTALQYEKEFSALGVDEDGEQVEDENLEDDFRHALLEDYRIMLQKESDYRDSDEYVDEGIRVNEYEFLENGELA